MVTYRNVFRYDEPELESEPEPQPSSMLSRKPRARRSPQPRKPVSPEEKQIRKARRERKKAELEQRLKAEAEARRHIIVGVDFGTTYTGCAYIDSESVTCAPIVLDNYPGGRYSLYEKMPTVSGYKLDLQFPKRPMMTGVSHGFNVTSEMAATAWFKLRLNDATNLPDCKDRLLEKYMNGSLLRLPEGMTAIDVSANYLRFTREHILQELETKIGEHALKRTRIRFFFTVPALWTETAREATLECVRRAGFFDRIRDEVIIIEEPEAAIVAAIRSTINSHLVCSFEPETCVMIVDMGGGTVDLVTYMIADLNPLNLEEACIGEGIICGGTTVDRQFYQWMEAKFGNSFTRLSIQKTGATSKLMSDFEKIKRDFKGGEEEEDRIRRLSLNMSKVDPEHSSYDSEEREVLITSADMKSFFEPFFHKTFKAVRRQIAQHRESGQPPLKNIVLCGGMASSPYVSKTFEKFIINEMNETVQLIVPHRAWSTIARGAAMIGHSGTPVVSRRSRDNIGISIREPFDKGKHSEADAVICPIEGKMAKNQARWLVKRGDIISPNMKIPLNVRAVFPDVDARERVRLLQDIYICTTNQPPSNVRDGVVSETALVEMDVTNCVRSQSKRLASTSGNGSQLLVELKVKIEITKSSENNMLFVSAKCGRKSIGSLKLEYCADPAWKGNFISKQECVRRLNAYVAAAGHVTSGDGDDFDEADKDNDNDEDDGDDENGEYLKNIPLES